MSDCIFCKIGAKQIQSMVVFDDDDLIAFRDINPQAPVHILIIPKKHYTSLNDVEAAEIGLIGRMFSAAKSIAKQEKINGSGYRLVMNTGANAGQSVAHLHLHLLGGRVMAWPPG
ncbi:MAG TPA: histidine triad nucleotide-binding protein [Planctomycetota bacterium]|nr:histidine triad nucleotide-binding protein [Planctomycetota bacterium]